jgi:hypothetical protein
MIKTKLIYLKVNTKIKINKINNNFFKEFIQEIQIKKD